jgi:hypothetical protein
MENPFFMRQLKKSSYKSCRQWKEAQHCQNGVKIQNFAIELAQTKLNWVESQVKSSLVPFFV